MLARGLERMPHRKVADEEDRDQGNNGASTLSDSMDTGSSKASEAARFRTAVVMTAIYVGAAVCFGCGIWYSKGQQAGFEFFAGYLVEQSLSVDNLFVFLMLFNYFQVPLQFQGRVLTWGILGAVAMRGVMILAGVAAVQRFRSAMLVFAAILLVSAVKLFFESDEPEELSHNLVMRISKKLTGATDEYDGDKFFTVVDGKTRATPLFLCLVCIELSDFVFAVDSIPAVIGVSQDLLVVYSSNIFAILGLRSLYTLVAKAVQDLPYLRPAVALVLAFIGLKMVLEYFYIHIPISISLGIVFSLLAGGIILSLYHKSTDSVSSSSNAGHGDNARHKTENGSLSASSSSTAIGVEDKLHRHPHHYDHDPEAAHDTNSRSSTAGAPPPNHPNQPTVTNTAATVAAASSSNWTSWFKASGSKEKEKGDDAATQLLITETAAAHH